MIEEAFKPVTGFFSQLINWGPGEMNELASRMEHRRFKKRQFLIEQGGPVNGYYFINSGFCRIFMDIEGKEKTLHFVGQYDFTTNIDCVLLKKNSDWTLEAVNDTDAVFISFDNALWARNNLAEGEKLIRRLWERYCALKSKEIYFHYNQDVLLKYENLLTLFPDIDQQVPQKMIASYLNCTPEYFSSLKAKAMKNGYCV